MTKKYSISVLGGDGTGTKVVEQAMKVVSNTQKKFDIDVNFREINIGGDRYLKTGELVTEEDIGELRESDAILLGAIGHPDVKPGILEQGILLNLRKKFDQYVNLRPVVLYPGVETPIANKTSEDINFVVVRENTEGLYAGAGGFVHHGTHQEVATQESINTRFAIERCIRYAFEYTKSSGREKVTLCAKTNVLTYAHDLWERAFNEVSKEYSDIKTDYKHVDALCMWMVKNPENVINPLAAIAAAAMMMENIGEKKYGKALESAIKKVAFEIPSLEAGKMGMGTSEIGDKVIEAFE